VQKPGPAKVESLNVAALRRDILRLRHGDRRSQGTTSLYEQYRHQISRRDLYTLVEAARRELRREEEALSRRIEWLVPGLVWSMDDTEMKVLSTGTGHIHHVRDLGSRFTLRALGDEALAHGEQVADNLVDLFSRQGAPLFLKRDNGSNLNHEAVDKALGEYGVIPLNSPVHYPPYNGGIERGQLEIQRELEARIGPYRVGRRVFRLECEVSGHEVNHKRRRSLGGRTACQVLEIGRPLVRAFGRRERKEAYEEIKSLAVDIAEQLDDDTGTAAETAFRYAAETWMQLNQFIRVTRNGIVLPCFHQF